MRGTRQRQHLGELDALGHDGGVVSRDANNLVRCKLIQLHDLLKAAAVVLGVARSFLLDVYEKQKRVIQLGRLGRDEGDFPPTRVARTRAVDREHDAYASKLLADRPDELVDDVVGMATLAKKRGLGGRKTKRPKHSLRHQPNLVDRVARNAPAQEAGGGQGAILGLGLLQGELAALGKYALVLQCLNDGAAFRRRLDVGMRAFQMARHCVWPASKEPGLVTGRAKKTTHGTGSGVRRQYRRCDGQNKSPALVI